MPYKRKHSLVIFPSPKLSSIHSEATTANINIVTCRVNVFTRHEASTHDFKNYLTAQLLRLRSTHLRLLPVLGFLIIYRSCYTTRLCFLLAANSCFRFAVSLWTCLLSLIRLNYCVFTRLALPGGNSVTCLVITLSVSSPLYVCRALLVLPTSLIDSGHPPLTTQ